MSWLPARSTIIVESRLREELDCALAVIIIINFFRLDIGPATAGPAVCKCALQSLSRPTFMYNFQTVRRIPAFYVPNDFFFVVDIPFQL